MKQFYKIICLSLLSIFATCAHAKEVSLLEPPQSDAGYYIKDVLTLSYQKLGFSVNWKPRNSSDELELANNARISGALARTTNIESDYPNLIRVPFPILQFSLLKVSDRERCGFCLNNKISSVAYVDGSFISEDYANSLPTSIRKFALSSSSKINKLILKRRVDTMLVMDFQIDPAIYLNPNFIVENVEVELDYHYLSPAMAHIKEPLNDVFKALDADGTLRKLQSKHHLSTLPQSATPPKVVNAISGNWLGYTNSDGSGIYWNLIKSIFNDEFEVTTREYIWERSVKLFQEQKADILVGAYLQEELSEHLYSTYHIDYEYPLFAFAQDQKALEDLTNKASHLSACTVAGSQSIKYVDFLPKENIVQTSLKVCNTLFAKKKVDIIIEYDYNLPKATNDLPKYVLKNAEPLFVVFQNTPEGHYLKQVFDKKMAKFALNDQLPPIYETEENYRHANIK